MDNSTIEVQAKMYVFDLGNCAKEFWFKDDEHWELCLVTGEQKTELEKRYYPTMSKKGFPETLTQLYKLVKSRMMKVNPQFLRVGSLEEMSSTPEFLIAFNRDRLR